MSKSAIYGSSSRIDPVHTRLCAKAEFEDFAPMPCNCLGFCVADAQRERQYAHVYENRMEANHPIAPFCCLTKEICIIDQIWVSYFDRPPVRAGMCCFCIPATCCGPPVLFAQSPKCGPIDLAPCFGQQIKAAPCNCFGLKAFLVCGNPCYVKSSVGLFGGLKNASAFLGASKAAVDAYAQKHNMPASQMAVFESVSDNIGDFGGSKDIVANPAAQAETISR